ncbi:MAG: LysE family translocator [Pseudoalteromonas sp.]|uniref:LysE family translocator n=1 Tax=unclassified Pseudoalteromonas TaxID=194690 RepID=UPI003F97E1C9
MPDLAILAVFIPTFFFVSITPGMCMTLAMTLGMTVGVRRALWMMVGEVIGVALVAVAAVIGVASVMLNYPSLFSLLKWLGGAYLIYLGVTMWRAKGNINANASQPQDVSRSHLFSQGFITAIANPKGWAFMISLLPPFIDVQYSVAPQLAILVMIIMLSEFICMMIYATGGKSLRVFLAKSDNVKWLNRTAGVLMMLVGVWLAFG